jgi:hypothetical protein
MRAEAESLRDWLLTACLLITLAVGMVCPGHAAQQPRASRTVESSGPQVLALAPDAALPPSTPAFSPHGPNLARRIVSTQGEPVLGARVFIDAAGPRVGRGYT